MKSTGPSQAPCIGSQHMRPFSNLAVSVFLAHDEQGAMTVDSHALLWPNAPQR